MKLNGKRSGNIAMKDSVFHCTKRKMTSMCDSLSELVSSDPITVKKKITFSESWRRKNTPGRELLRMDMGIDLESGLWAALLVLIFAAVIAFVCSMLYRRRSRR